MFDDAEGLNADTFVAQNTTKKIRPPSSRHSMNKKRMGENEYDGIDAEDDDFINEMTQPMKAKTKHELIGTRGHDRSRQSSKSRSRSKSNEKSMRSSKKMDGSFKITGGKMLNEAS